MRQLHKRFADEQIKVVLQAYCHGLLPRAEVQHILSIGKTRLFELLSQYRQDAESFSVAHERTARSRLSAAEETEIGRALLQQKELVQDKRLPISSYNYSAIRDRLAKKGINVPVNTVINRAKRLGCQGSPTKRLVGPR